MFHNIFLSSIDDHYRLQINQCVFFCFDLKPQQNRFTWYGFWNKHDKKSFNKEIFFSDFHIKIQKPFWWWIHFQCRWWWYNQIFIFPFRSGNEWNLESICRYLSVICLRWSLSAFVCKKTFFSLFIQRKLIHVPLSLFSYLVWLYYIIKLTLPITSNNRT